MDEQTKHLLELLHASDHESRNQALSGILKLPKFAQAELAPEFVELLREGNEQAARALRYLGTWAERVLPDLIDTLNDKNPSVRIAAAGVLCEMQNAAVDALPTLINMMREDDYSIRAAAIRAAGRIRIGTPDLITALIERLQDGNDTVRSLAASALGRLHSDAREAVPALTTALDDSYEPTRILALQGLERIGDIEKHVLSAIVRRLSDPYRTVSSEAAGILVRAGKSATDEITAALQNPHQHIVIATLDALARFGKDSGDLSPTIVSRLTDPSEKVRQAAVSAFYKLYPNQAPPKLLAALSDENQGVRQRAASYLKNFSLPNDVEALVEAIQQIHFDMFARTCLMETLLKTQTQQGIQALIDFLREGQLVENRCAAADAAGSMDAVETVPVLIENLSDESAKIRHHAVMALERLASPDAAPALIERLDDKDHYIRDWAEKALIKIGAPAVMNIIPLLQHTQKADVAKRILIHIGTPEALRSVENL